ncbi:MAG: hypothetical protein IPN57_09885 [Ignavibacteria bacterium]|nr:hypothetical protein [Ignavibacteria bacterium]
MRKIKLVKLNKEFNNGISYAVIGTELSNTSIDNLYRLQLDNGDIYHFSNGSVRKNTAGLFAIEYEPEKFELKRYTEYGFIDYDSFMKRELNRLADWCDGQSEKDEDKLYFEIVNTEESKLNIAIYIFTYHQGLKFHSEKSADLFLSELKQTRKFRLQKLFY